MKVLYIGHYRESGGWAQATKDQILALDSVGVDVVCRNVTLTKDKEISGRLLELEKKDSQGCDVCIQHVLPHHLIGTKQFRKNIAFVETETTSIKHLPWFDMLKLTDEVWVPNQQARTMFDEDKLGRPVEVVHHTCDITKYAKDYKTITLPPAEGKFKFYYLGDVNDRKNIEAIVTAFHSEFDSTDAAAMIFKVGKFGMSNDEMKVAFDQMLFNVKQRLRMYPSIEGYIKDITILGDIPEDHVYGLHQYCDCFMGPSHGEAWSIPAFDAMAFGNTPICSNFGGPVEFIDQSNAYTGALINGSYKVCKCSDAAFPDMFTGREYWFDPDERALRRQMRQYYEQWRANPLVTKKDKQAAGFARAKLFDYKTVGERMKGLLNE